MLQIATNKNKNNSGFGMAEAVIAVSILASFVIVVSGVNTLYLNMALGDKQPLTASSLLEEGIEAVKFLRDDSWTDNIATLTSGTSYYLAYSSGWSLTTTPSTSGIFSRTIVVSDVYRDGSDDIVELGGVLDPGTKLVTVEVSWQSRNGSSTRNLKTYITNLFGN